MLMTHLQIHANASYIFAFSRLPASAAVPRCLQPHDNLVCGREQRLRAKTCEEMLSSRERDRLDPRCGAERRIGEAKEEGCVNFLLRSSPPRCLTTRLCQQSRRGP